MTWIALAIIAAFAIGYAGPAYDLWRLEKRTFTLLLPFRAYANRLQGEWGMGPGETLSIDGAGTHEGKKLDFAFDDFDAARKELRRRFDAHQQKESI